MNIFEQATRIKLRFDSAKGPISVEDLWKAPLTSTNGYDLDTLAKQYSKKMKDSETESFVHKSTEANATYKLQFDIIKHIIDVKLDEADVAKNVAATKAQIDQIRELMVTKQNEALAGKSMEELGDMLSKLSATLP